MTAVRRPCGARVADTHRLPGAALEHWAWQLRAVCRGMPTDAFFHPDYERGPERQRREAWAKAICAQCPVIDACRRHALTVDEPYGVWGGLSESEREALTARRLR
jgi:WhiB family redox-sensing transcriptional regulator